MIYALSIFLGAAGAFCISRWADRLGLMDQPNHRSSHIRPTPKAGGIGIAISFLFSALLLELTWTFWLPVFAVSLVGLYGDKIHISPLVRLTIQFIAALIMIWGAETNMTARLLPFWMVFIVGSANCFNFMDGINGIAGITSIIGFILLGICGKDLGLSPIFSSISFVMALACTGFLPFNIPKAAVFMGDVGSILLGFVFGGLVFLSSQSIVDFLCLSAFMFPFYSDEIVTKAIQLKEKSALMKPHRNHLYQLMANEMEIAHWKISAGYGLLQLLVGVSVMVVRPFGISKVLLLLVGYFIFFVIINSIIREKVQKRQRCL